MEKPAPTRFPVHELVARRWSPRAFSERPIEPEKLRSVFEAARWAPSSMNEQPWRFIMASRDDEATWNKLLACLVETNRMWAFRAPVLILSVANLNFEENGRPNRHALHDTGMAVENLVLQAVACGLAAHQMAGFDVEKARAGFRIPAEYQPLAVIAVGYPGDPTILPDNLRARELSPRERNEAAAFVFSGEWGRPSPLLA
jgi:nitroreductase